MHSTLLLFSAFFVGVSYAALPLPSYIKACARSDPKFFECSLEHAKAAIPSFIKGERKYGIPPLSPLEIAEMKMESGPKQAGISLRLTNVKVLGVDSNTPKDIHYEVEKSINYFDIDAKKLALISDYEITGRILLLPITGRGLLNITLVDNKLHYESDSHIEERDGKRWVVFENPKFNISASREYYNLTNLFNGDKLLGEEMNKLLNNNWEDAHRELAAPIIDALGEVILGFMNSFCSHVPYDVWLPETL